MKVLILSFLIGASCQGENLDKFFSALAKVESSGNPRAVNVKEKALGIYQIRPAFFLDSGVKGKHEDCFNPVFARKVCEGYYKRYAAKALKEQDFESLARCHNSGWNFAKKKHLTNAYWNKVRKNLN